MTLTLIHTTLDDAERADDLARQLLARRLAACVTVGAPVRSYYVWQGQNENAREYPLTVKTTAARADAVLAFFCAHHPYELPEILVQHMDDAEQGYADWIRAQVAD